MDPLLEKALTLPRGAYLVIEPDGFMWHVLAKPTLEHVYQKISTPTRQCICCDTVTLRLRGNSGDKDPIVMMVDDTGMLDKLPVNETATKLARLARPGFPHEIYGTAVIINDTDFA